MNIYKKYFYVFILLVSLSLSGVSVFNYFVDSTNQFYRAEEFSSKVSRMLLNEKKVMVRTNFNERLLQKLMLSNIPHRPDVLVLGSSHSLLITKELFAPLSFYNASVSNAELEDDIALYYIFQKRNWKPKIVVICVDPWILDPDFAALFNGKQASQQWKSSLLLEYLNAKKLLLMKNDFTDYVDRISSLFDKYTQLLSIDLLKHSIASILFNKIIYPTLSKSSLSNPAFENTYSANEIISSNHYDDCESCNLLLPDGSRLLSKKEEATTLAEVNLSVLKLMQALQLSNQQYSKNSAVEPIHKDIFERFIQYLVSNNVKIIFYLPPLDPLAYRQIIEKNPNYQLAKGMEEYFISVAAKYHLQVVGSYNPTKLGLTGNDFFDSSHLKAKGIHKIFRYH